MKPILLSDVVAEVESGGLLHAVRFEPELYDRLLRRVDEPAVAAVFRTCRRCHGWPGWVSTQTVAVILSCSWGRYQILGWNLYAHMLYKGPVWAYLLDQDAQYRSFEGFIGTFGMTDVEFGRLDDEALMRFARYYNGPGNVRGYAARLRAAFKRLASSPLP